MKTTNDYNHLELSMAEIISEYPGDYKIKMVQTVLRVTDYLGDNSYYYRGVEINRNQDSDRRYGSLYQVSGRHGFTAFGNLKEAREFIDDRLVSINANS